MVGAKNWDIKVAIELVIEEVFVVVEVDRVVEAATTLIERNPKTSKKYN